MLTEKQRVCVCAGGVAFQGRWVAPHPLANTDSYFCAKADKSNLLFAILVKIFARSQGLHVHGRKGGPLFGLLFILLEFPLAYWLGNCFGCHRLFRSAALVFATKSTQQGNHQCA